MMQTSWTTSNDQFDNPYWNQAYRPANELQPPTRPAPSPSPSHFPAPSPAHQSEGSRDRLPRTSSLLPPPHTRPSSRSHSRTDSNHARPSVGAPSDYTQPSPEGRTDRDKATWASRSPNTFVNRWSASTGSSRSNSASRNDLHRHNRQASSVDTTFLLTSSPPSAKRVSRKLHKTRPSDQSDYHSNTRRNESPTVSRSGHSPGIGLPTLDPLPSLSQDYTTAWRDHQTSQGSSHQRINSRSPEETRSSYSTAPTPGKMPYHHSQDSRGGQGHSRQRSGKSSTDSTSKSKGSKPSQKATLSRALQKANYAVELDNTSDTAGARDAYAEACALLQQVLQRTSAPEDKQKLEAIRLTYTSRIDELDQMLPYNGHDTKALPDYPDEHGGQAPDLYRHGHDSQDDFETATMTTVVNDDRSIHTAMGPPTHPWQQENPSGRGSPSQLAASPMALQNPEPGFLQSSFSRSPVRSRFPDNVMQVPGGSSRAPAHVSAVVQQPPPTQHHRNDLDGPVRSDFSVTSESRSGSRRGLDHMREDSQNSWLDPIDESGGSTASSVHSRTSSLGYRRRHIRSGSGDTEAEFDTALDAAIEAAYDDGYEPAEEDSHPDPQDDVVANALRRVELARQRVRQTEREAYEMASEHERERFQLQPQQHDASGGQAEGFFDDNSSEEEERMLEEMTREYGMHDMTGRSQHGKQRPVPRESDSSGFTSRTWQSSIASNPPGTGTTSLSTVAETINEKPPMPPPKGPAPQAPAPAPPPTHALPEIPVPTLSSSAETVRNRRLSSQNLKQLRIETSKLAPPPQPSGLDDSSQPRSTPMSELRSADPMDEAMRPRTAPRRPSSPPDPSPMDTRDLGSPFGHRVGEGQENSMDRSVSPSMSKLKKNFSSSSLRSLKSRNMSVSNIDEGAESPGTPSSSQWNSSRTPAVPSIPTNMAATLYRTETTTGGMHLIEDTFHTADTPGSPDQGIADAPVSLEPCPQAAMLRPFWLMRCLYQTLVHPRGGYVSTKLFVPREAWKVKGVKLKNLEDKIANCDYLSAALLKLARVDTFDADAMLEEMQSMEGVLDQTQAALSRKLGNEVGTQSVGSLFKDAPNTGDGDPLSALPRSTSVSGKSSFSWRRLRTKNSAAALSTGTQGRGAGSDAGNDSQPMKTLPMTPMPTSKPARRDMSIAQFTGPYAQYMGSLARLFDAAQVIDQIARQVEDPGLKGSDKTQVGLELCTRHAAEFFAFYICRFVLSDVGMLMDKFVKRGSEWVLT